MQEGTIERFVTDQIYAKVWTDRATV